MCVFPKARGRLNITSFETGSSCKAVSKTFQTRGNQMSQEWLPCFEHVWIRGLLPHLRCFMEPKQLRFERGVAYQGGMEPSLPGHVILQLASGSSLTWHCWFPQRHYPLEIITSNFPLGTPLRQIKSRVFQQSIHNHGNHFGWLKCICQDRDSIVGQTKAFRETCSSVDVFDHEPHYRTWRLRATKRKAQLGYLGTWRATSELDTPLDTPLAPEPRQNSPWNRVRVLALTVFTGPSGSG